jgi:hypothetical protein
MSDFTRTPNLGLYKPVTDADPDMWGEHLNANADILDVAVPAAGTGGGGGSLSGVTKTDRSGAITLGGTAQSLMAANAARKGWSFQNKSSADMYFNDLGGTASATANNATYLPAGAYYESEPGGASVQAISIFCATTNASFAAKEW